MMTKIDEYKLYEEAVKLLQSNFTTTTQRKTALLIRDNFEHDLRSGKFKHIFESYKPNDNK